jgi:hypothetical protein
MLHRIGLSGHFVPWLDSTWHRVVTGNGYLFASAFLLGSIDGLKLVEMYQSRLTRDNLTYMSAYCTISNFS